MLLQERDRKDTMRKSVKVIGFAIVGLLGLLVLAAGGWFYVMSNVEQPKYRVVLNEGAIELRDYPPLIVAEAGAADGETGVRHVADAAVAERRA